MKAKESDYFNEKQIILQWGKTAPVAENINMEKLGERIKSARMARGLTEEELSQMIGIDKGTLIYLETGNPNKPQNPKIKTLYRIAYVLNVSIDWLCGFSKYPETKLVPKEIVNYLYIQTMLEMMNIYTIDTDGDHKYFKIPCDERIYGVYDRLIGLYIKYTSDVYDVSQYEYEKERKRILNELSYETIESIKKKVKCQDINRSFGELVEEIDDDDLPF